MLLARETKTVILTKMLTSKSVNLSKSHYMKAFKESYVE